MTKTGKILTVLGLTAAVGAPVAVYATTRNADTKTANGTTAKGETITCPMTGDQIEPCCCPLNKKIEAKQ